jgi:CxxC-x17-CxxC domain-containing protein
MRFGLTIVVDDAGSGDLLFGVVIGAYREETSEFKYDILDVRFYQPELFSEKEYLQESRRIVSKLIAKLSLNPEEEIHICQGCIFDAAVEELRETYGEDKVKRVRVAGEAQKLVEISYLDEIRNLGYEPLEEREDKRAKSFFHMMRWIKTNPDMLKYAKTGWPRLKRYRLFQPLQQDNTPLHKASCSECGAECEVPFKPDPHRPVYCQECWAPRKQSKKRHQS